MSCDNIFITQSKTRSCDTELSTDWVLSDESDMERNFDVKNLVFSDISDDEVAAVNEATREVKRFSRPLQKNDLTELVKGGLSKKRKVNRNGQFRCSNSGKIIENYLQTVNLRRQ